MLLSVSSFDGSNVSEITRSRCKERRALPVEAEFIPSGLRRMHLPGSSSRHAELLFADPQLHICDHVRDVGPRLEVLGLDRKPRQLRGEPEPVPFRPSRTVLSSELSGQERHAPHRRRGGRVRQAVVTPDEWYFPLHGVRAIELMTITLADSAVDDGVRGP